MRFINLFFFVFISQLAFGQVLIFPETFEKGLDTVTFHQELPDELLQKKSAVIYLSPYNNWKEKSGEVQKGLKRAGIDAVVHYHINDIYSGKESIKAYRQQLIDREIDFLIYYDNQPQPELIIHPFNGDLVAESAYRLSNPNLSDLLNQLYRKSAQSEQQKTNLLILEVPAYMDYPKVISGRRAEFYDLNMKSGKLAIPKMQDSVLNQAFDSIMASYYPFEYGFVEPGLSEDELRKEGYWFIMYGIQGTGKLVRNLLEYNTTKEETAYASVVAENGDSEVKTFPVDQHVVKFYIKDVKNNDLFLGKHYDADITWESALKNYILNLKNILVR
ncbi:MAG: hypothetical protein ACNS60_13040 [Candidatus Cyclobacteriaceae bacterium M2_1C_046]